MASYFGNLAAGEHVEAVSRRRDCASHHGLFNCVRAAGFRRVRRSPFRMASRAERPEGYDYQWRTLQVCPRLDGITPLPAGSLLVSVWAGFQ